MIYIEHKKCSKKTLNKKYPDAIIADVTSKAKDSLIKLSPFYPHGNIPIPFSEKNTAASVEGIWQGLKVFERAKIDVSSFENTSMKNMKRTIKKFGAPLGHQKGLYSAELLDYIEARILIYLPSYKWVLENKANGIISRMKNASAKNDIVLLDYTTNHDVLNPRNPLSHAFLIKAFIEENFPDGAALLQRYQEREILSLTEDFHIKNPKGNSKTKSKKTLKSDEQSQQLQINLTF